MISDREILLLQHRALGAWESLSASVVIALSPKARRRYRRFASASSMFQAALGDAKRPVSGSPRTAQMLKLGTVAILAVIGLRLIVSPFSRSEPAEQLLSSSMRPLGGVVCQPHPAPSRAKAAMAHVKSVQVSAE